MIEPTGLAILVLAFAALIAVIRGRQRLEARIGQASLVLEGIDRAVNHQPPGAPSLVQRVATLEARTTRIEERVNEIAEAVLPPCAPDDPPREPPTAPNP